MGAMAEPEGWLKVSQYMLRILSDSSCQHIFHALGLRFEITIHPDREGERIIVYGLENPAKNDGDPEVTAQLGLGDCFEREFDLYIGFGDEDQGLRDHVLLPNGSSLSQCINALRRQTRATGCRRQSTNADPCEISALGFIAQILSGATQTKLDKGKGIENPGGRHQYVYSESYPEPAQNEPSPSYYDNAIRAGYNRIFTREAVVGFLESCLNLAQNDPFFPYTNVTPTEVESSEAKESEPLVKSTRVPRELSDKEVANMLAMDARLRDMLGMNNEQVSQSVEEADTESTEEVETNPVEEKETKPAEKKETKPAQSAGISNKKQKKIQRRHKPPKW
ncbi:hypothetical protein RRF57_002829 [Xylaria bambusicola]|uniref:Uncharacterized protein n=1 Tax=Xylaria bambusicola TaxID=326684 RepID=A0AAN7UDQ1_9PEZI